MSELEVEVAGQRLHLLPDKALYLPDSASLLVADVHLGKAHTFRRLGVPVPSGTTRSTLEALTLALARTRARRLVVLGDLLHGPAAQDDVVQHALAAWREQHAGLDIILVRGNHDDRAGNPPAHLGITVVTEGDEQAVLQGLVLRHHPQPSTQGYVLAGHSHPSVRLRGRAHASLRTPCFWLGLQVGVLPAFGDFTGGYLVRPERGDRIFAVAAGRVHALPPTGR